MTQFLIDADTAIYAMAERHSPLIERLSTCFPGDVAISAISFAEIAVGSYVGKPPRQEVLDAFVEVIEILPFDENAARRYAQLPFKRARFDRLLAAHALSLG
ncbi:MAG: VapC toxin family PIN domain ribonuclease, partial [Sphingomonas sp. 12-62-6]